MRFDGDKLAQLMRKRNLTVNQLHQAMVRAGADITPKALYTWLNGMVAYPHRENRKVLADVLGVADEAFFTVTESAPAVAQPSATSVAAHSVRGVPTGKGSV